MKQFTISKNDSGQRLNKFLEKAVPLLPGGMMHKYIRIKRIKVNGKRTDFAYRLQQGDILQLYINDEFFGKPKKHSEEESYLHAKPNIDVIYEDQHILLVNKPAGLVVHADDSGTSDTLIARIQAYLYQYGRWDPNKEASFTPSLCNRIDRGTSGIVIAAKTAEALRVMNQKIRDRELHKSYLCVACGHIRPRDGRIKNYILRHESEHRVSVHDHPGCRCTHGNHPVPRIKRNAGVISGRVRFDYRPHPSAARAVSHMGHPLLGDSKYGKNDMNRKYHRKSQALCSYKLRFDFTTDAGSLGYLNHKVFTAPRVEFVSLFEA